ncbi:hypothetical protein QBC39DRAFT_13401 [Podospora conica]|nr:hypothetical protein QBC39DRAFT_13401 [Schizothecium conicum]
MAAVSQTTMSTLTPPSSSHGGTGYSWDMSVHQEKFPREHPASISDEPPNTDPASRKQGQIDLGPDMKGRGGEPTYISSHPHKDLRLRGVRETGSAPDSLLDLYDGAKDDRLGKGPLKKTADEMYAGTAVGLVDNSKWIHRDKLARIENEELQAAGIYLPKPRDRDRDSARSRSQNRAKQDPSQDRPSGPNRTTSGPEPFPTRSRKNSAVAVGDLTTLETPSSPAAWDPRLPEEIAEEIDGFWVPGSNGRGSRIPVAKVSPVPIPSEHLERDTLLVRKRDSSPEDDSIHYPKPRTRSGSTANTLVKTPTNGSLLPPATQPNKPVSPKKPTAAAGARKPSGAKPAVGAAGRPKTRGGPSKDSTSSGGGTTRPSTRSGERELSIGSSKQMEGEPPWMVSAYRPDPRLPPDQQLLPTVAKRLQQEKWEREGKFGNVYDKEFRPLTDEGFPKPPEHESAPEKDEEDEKTPAQDRRDEREEGQPQEGGGDWPLRAELRGSQNPARSSSYSTMPRISDKPPMSPLASGGTTSQPPPRAASVVRAPEPPEEAPEKKAGCGCCIVM